MTYLSDNYCLIIIIAKIKVLSRTSHPAFYFAKKILADWLKECQKVL
jgi:hypothetical protein